MESDSATISGSATLSTDFVAKYKGDPQPWKSLETLVVDAASNI